MDNFNKYFFSGGLHSEEAESIYNFLIEYKIESILEIGCGNSSTSLFLDYINLKPEYSLISYENDKNWASLIAEKFSHNVQTYTPGDLTINNFYDLIFIDGPLGSNNRESSFISALNKSKYIIAHDFYSEHIKTFVNKYYLQNNLYSKINIKQPLQTSGLIFLTKNEN